jgi:quercetin dioxygenase-like cupin family protein
VIIRKSGDIHAEPVTGEIYFGEINSQFLMRDPQESPMKVTHAHFEPGGGNRLHTHSFDQLLVITDGVAVIGDGQQEFELNRGDIVFTPAGEPHSHGATPGHPMSHIVVMGYGETNPA